MARTPKLRSFQEIRKALSQIFVRDSGVNDLNDGSVARSLLDAAALSDFQNQSDIIAVLSANDIDRAEGLDLDNIGIAEGIPRPQALSSTGFITIIHSTIQKVATKIYAGAAAPAIGSTTINISSREFFPNSGSVYLGRGSNNVEGPIAYSSITDVGNYFQLNLSAPTVKNHNVNETVILAQGGDRFIGANTVVRTKQNATSPSVLFNVLNAVTIPDGEDRITDVPVISTQLGSVGNVSAGAISEFTSDPFPGAVPTNPTAFVSGRDKLSDPDYRLLIKNTIQTRTKGTDLAIKTAAVGVTSSDDNKTVASAEIRKPSQRDEPAILFVDDGTAYQPIFKGQGFEQVIEDANGGESFLQLQKEDITKALLQTSFTAPFTLTGSYILAVRVGGELSEHTFASGDFAVQNAADTFEIVNSINSNTSLLFSARAAENSKKIVIFAKDFKNEDMQLVAPTNTLATNANEFLGFPENRTFSLRLYKNDELLYKDGEIPTINSRAQSSWSIISGSKTLILSIDKQANPITYTFQDSDFVAYGYAVMSETVPLSVWADVFNSIIPGITASVDGNTLKIVSNKGASNDARITISGGTLKNLIFDTTALVADQGVASDYALNRSTGQIQLTTPLVAGDDITAGSKNTQAFLQSVEIPSGTVNLPAGSATLVAPTLWIMLDDVSAEFITNTANAGSAITITNPATDIWRFTSSDALAFANVLVNDFVVISDSAIQTHNSEFVGHFKVVAKAGADSFDIRLTQALGTTSGALTIQTDSRFAFIRSEAGTIQPIELLSGLNTLTAIANDINTQLTGGRAAIVNGRSLKLQTNTYAETGSIIIAGISDNASGLGYLPGQQDNSTVSHTAFSESGSSELTIPEFIHDVIATGDSTQPYTAFDSTLTLLNEGVDRNKIISFLNPYNGVSSNKKVYSQINNMSGVAIEIESNLRLKDIIASDRFFVASPFNFNALDNLVAIIDRDGVNKSLNIPLGRKGVVSVAVAQDQFNAFDADAGPTADYPDQFGNNFSFDNFKIQFNARQIFDPSGIDNKFLARSAAIGPTGERIRFGIDYPTVPNAALNSTTLVREFTDVQVFLASGAERLGGAWDSTTQFDVTTPVANMYRYTFNGIGTAPLFLGAGIIPGDIINISNSSDFHVDNVGVFKITAVTNTYFEVTNYNGVLENNIQLNNPSDLVFYPLDAAQNTASLVEAYVAANLSQYLTLEQLESGAGAISTSTFDDELGVAQYLQLVDGESWVLVSNIGTTAVPVNLFTLKQQLLLPESDPDYTLVGEEFYLVPTMADQLSRYLNVFAVTGLSSLANINTSSDAGKLQIYSNLFGTNGAVQISGGSANSAEAPAITTGSAVAQANLRNPFGITRSGSTVTVETSERHDLIVGDIVDISSVNNLSFNGRFTITAVTPKTFTYTQAHTYPIIDATPNGADRQNGTIIFETTLAHGLSNGDQVNVVNMDNPSFDGLYVVASVLSTVQFQVNTSVGDALIDVAPTGASRTTNVATLTTTTNHNVSVNDEIVVLGVTDSSFDGTFTVLSTPTPTTLTYANVGADTTSGSGEITNVRSGGGDIDQIESNNGVVTLPNIKFNIDAANKAGFEVGQYINVANQETLQKDLDFNQTTQIALTNNLTTATVAVSTQGSFQMARTTSADATTEIKVSKHQQFICLSWTGIGTAPNFVNVQEGDWLKIDGSFDLSNQGIFQVIRKFKTNTIYIINDNAIEEEVVMSANSDLSFYSYDSVMPGDQFIISSDILGANNLGTYTVASSPFPTSSQFEITELFANSIAATTLSTDFETVIIKEATPFATYRKIINISQDPSDSEAYTLVLDTDAVGNKINAAVGAQASTIGKLQFPTTVQTGEDSYKYYGGLISAVGKTIRGQAEDPVGFPGVSAAGSYIEITSPLPREITISIVVRNNTGIPFSTIKSRIQSAVSAYVNSLDVGESVVFSQVVSVVQQINGVQALAISSPTYDQSNLQIVLNEDEKAVVTTINNITVSLASN